MPAVSGGLYTLPVDPKWYTAHPEWFLTPSPLGGPMQIPVPAATRVLAVTTGRVVSVTPRPSGTRVVLTGLDGATYTYRGGHAVRVKPGQQLKPAQPVFQAGRTGFSLEINVPDVATPVCVQPAFGSWAAGTTVDVHALPVAGCGSPAAVTPGERVLIVADPPSAGMANQVSKLLTDEGLRAKVAALPTPLAELPATEWSAVIDSAVAKANPTVAVVVAGVDKPAPSAAVLGAGINTVMAGLPGGVQLTWVRPGPTQPTQPTQATQATMAATATGGTLDPSPARAPSPALAPSPARAPAPAPADAALAAVLAGHMSLRVENVQTLAVSTGGTASPAGRPADGAQADQANAGAVVDYLDTSQTWLGTTRTDWALSFAQRIGATSPAAAEFVMAWTLEEGANAWANNPLNSSLQTTGSTLLAGNPDGVRIYPSVLSGLDADARTLLGNPAYASVVAALRSGNVAQAAAALENSPWCVSPTGGPCPGYGSTIENLVALWNLVALGEQVSAPVSPAVLATGAEPVGGALTPVSTPAGAPANFGPVWQFLVAQLGKPYQWGGAGPDTWDCSGLVMAAYARAGIPFVHFAASQYSATANHLVPLAALEPGDLLFWAYSPRDPSSIHHVGVYVGDGMVLDAPYTGTVVQIQPLWTDGLYGVTRPLAET